MFPLPQNAQRIVRTTSKHNAKQCASRVHIHTAGPTDSKTKSPHQTNVPNSMSKAHPFHNHFEDQSGRLQRTPWSRKALHPGNATKRTKGRALHDGVATKKEAPGKQWPPRNTKSQPMARAGPMSPRTLCASAACAHRVVALPQHCPLRSGSALTTAIECDTHGRIQCRFDMGRLRASLCATDNSAKETHREFRRVV